MTQHIERMKTIEALSDSKWIWIFTN
uniref:Uncharacterized protein n=1 Tax=Tetranychus urticae TaxID=32264 RepID=T1KF17_TETUR